MPNYVVQVSKDSGTPFQIMDKGARELISNEVTARETAVSDLTETISKNFDVVGSPIMANAGKYIGTNGALKNNASWNTTGYITVKGPCLYVQGDFSSLSGAGYNIGLYDSEHGFVSGYTLGAEGTEGKFFDVSNAVYVMISNISAETFVYGFSSNSREAEVVRKEMSSMTLSASDYTVTGYLRTDGTVNSGGSDWATTDFIPVSSLGMYVSGEWFSLSGAGYNVCAYDNNENFIRGFACNAFEDMKFLDVSDASYVRFSSHTPNLAQTIVFAFHTFNANKEVVVDINGNGEYTSLLAALKGTPATTQIRLRSGTYDLIEEYKAFYGNDFFDNYEGYAGVSDPFYRGLWLDRGRKIRGDAGTIIQCIYTGSNTDVSTYFSAIANAGDILLENVTLKHGNLRYAIHDDYGAINETIRFSKIRFIGHSSGAPIGAGLGLNTTVIIEDCVFEENRQRWDINYHGSNTESATNVNRIYVKNCKGNRGFGIWPNGPATTLSTAFVSNSVFSEISCYRPEGQDESQTMNVELVEWNNTIVNQ